MRLFNSKTLKKEEFVPFEKGKVKFYSCGPTVYNYFHIGNARPFIVFDCLRRYFEYLGYEVTFVQNFTDVDDKMINKAKDLGVTVKELGEQYIEEYYKDAHALGIKDATIAPKATENIDEIIKIVENLIEKGYAYEVNGDVYFAVRKFKNYGELSHQSIDELEEGARIDVSEQKNDPLDFALWKAQKVGAEGAGEANPRAEREGGEIAWDSPWGMGRPGWHIECSAMAEKYLGKTIDIHSGGKDLIFPHHQNEIAQSECANGCEFARFWLHNGHINVDNQKMSKSLGNFWTVRDILEKDFSPDVVRLFILSSHYRSPMNFSFDILKQIESSLERIKTARENIEFMMKVSIFGELERDFKEVISNFKEALDDDFNTPKAISVIFELVNQVYNGADNWSEQSLVKAFETFDEMLDVLGFEFADASAWTEEEKKLLDQRSKARADKDWTKSDELRDKLQEMGISVKDTKDGQNATRV